jgi:hypothetical protein
MMITSTPNFDRACAESLGASMPVDRPAVIQVRYTGLDFALGSGVT